MSDQATAMVHKVTDELLPHLVDATALKVHPDNPRRGDVEAVAQSLDTFGQIKPVVVQASTGYIVAGNHTFKATQHLGWTHVAAITVPLSDDDAKRYLLADNRTSDKGGYDESVLAELLESMMLAGHLDGTGYTPDDVDDLLAQMDALPETEPEEFTGGFAESEEETADRYASASAKHTPMRQFVVLYDAEQAEQFENNVKALVKAWGVGGMREAVAEAVSRAAEQVAA